MTTRALLCLSVVLITGCEKATVSQTAPSKPMASERECMPAPWLLDVSSAAMGDGTFTLRATITGTLAFPAGMTVAAELPRGVTIVEGDAMTAVPEGRVGPFSTEIRVRGDEQQVKATEFVAHVATPSLGWHARRSSVGEAPPAKLPQPDPRIDRLARAARNRAVSLQQ